MDLINAIDQYFTTSSSHPMQVGENGHREYGWSKDIKERITQFYFQLVRTSYTQDLEKTLRYILTFLKEKYDEGDKDEALNYLSTMYKIIAETRDIIDGKGEYELTYMQIYNWYDFFPTLAKYAFTKLLQHDDNTKHQYGSWKDFKFFAEYVLERSGDKKHPLIIHGIHIMNETLQEDYEKYRKQQPVSLAAKWCPREKSSFSWLYKDIVYHGNRQYFDTATDKDSKYRAYKKASMSLRFMLSTLNKYIDTVQIKMCDDRWRYIDFNKVPSCALSKNRMAFMNKRNEKGIETQRSEKEDRIECAVNLEKHMNKVIENSLKKDDDETKENVKVNGKRVGIQELVKQALSVKNDKDTPKYNLVNLQWDDNSKQNRDLPKIIPMADVSPSMKCNNNIPLYTAIGMSIRVSEKTTPEFRDRILTFSSNPQWVNLENCDNFVDKVKNVARSEWGCTTDFYNALKSILDVIVKNNINPGDVKDMSLIVFSDMQMNECSHYNGSLYENIKQMYHNAGLNSEFQTPYEPPHIVFWNLSSTTGFPSLSYDNNVTMISGYSPVMLNELCDKGIQSLKNYNPYQSLIKILSNGRYKQMEDKLYSSL